VNRPIKFQDSRLQDFGFQGFRFVKPMMELGGVLPSHAKFRYPRESSSSGVVLSRTRRLRLALLAAAFFCLAGTASVKAEEVSWQLRPAVQVDGEGVFLNQLVDCSSNVPSARLCDAPAFGKTTVLSRAQLIELAKTAGVEAVLTNWSGAENTRVSRRSKTLGETEALQMLTSYLQTENVKERGELELRFSRPWTALTVPDEILTLKVMDLPSSGVMPVFIARFEFQTVRGERLGPWQVAVQARVMREAWVARSPLKRGERLSEAGVSREKRDVLLMREALADFDPNDSNLEIGEPVPAGSVVFARTIKVRPVVFRGQSIAAMLQDGALAITLKVEALEDGAPGQVIRVRNPLSRRDLRGKVLDEKNVLVSL
jgi:flagellar basal body P-ring formation protein FlgA